MAASFVANARIVVESLADYYRDSMSRRRPVISQRPLGQLIEELELKQLAVEGGLDGERLQRFLQRYLDATTRLHHPAYLAHQVAVPHPNGALAALIDGFTNNAMAIYEMGPPAAAIEYFIIQWLLQKIGWHSPPEKPPDASGPGGVLTHGGSLANLTALLAARARAAPEAWKDGNPGDLALLVPAAAHYSIARAAGILGIGVKHLYLLETDSRGLVRPDRLEDAYRQVCGDGRRPLALVANACSTATGLFDPLEEIGAFCRERSIWFHVDGAHGAGALLSATYRSRLRGVEYADSLVWDAHKLMRTPTLCAAVLVKDSRDLDQAFQQEAGYLFHDKDQPGVDFIHRTVECTKAGLGLKFFAVLGTLGEKGLSDYIDRQFRLAEAAYRYIDDQPDFECPLQPMSNILCFGFRNRKIDPLAVRRRLIAQGAFYLSSADIGPRRYLRLVLMNPETSLEDIERLLAAIRMVVSQLRAPSQSALK